ncbi:hypothetical protein [Cupriavidus pauculus]|uniref:Uncharacterized protein n=1 Tax=Cupriavidus pauculus TaxID=82633 RepID=A0A3G8H0K4_9BURK|nr:hypothetical protein [Cupriavidus pauculus]AZG13829.1 hypothetical protein EHF44_10430 [Cupriavidus pauculus]
MTKFFDKDLEEQLGTGAALQIAALASELRGQMDSYDAIRKAQGKPTLEEEMDEAIEYVRQMVARGEARREDYPEIFEDEPGSEG